jgi:hypothetical protein
MAELDSRETCNSCKFFINSGFMGVCKRYPDTRNKHETEWCGEFVFKKSAQVVESIVESLVKEPAPETPKKQGRPRKAKNET